MVKCVAFWPLHFNVHGKLYLQCNDYWPVASKIESFNIQNLVPYGVFEWRSADMWYFASFYNSLWTFSTQPHRVLNLLHVVCASWFVLILNLILRIPKICLKLSMNATLAQYLSSQTIQLQQKKSLVVKSVIFFLFSLITILASAQSNGVNYWGEG